MILSEQETYHEKLMRAIVKNLVDTPMVLKGGTALYLGYGLNRFSENLDFDCCKKINLLSKVKSTIPNGIILNDIHIKKIPIVWGVIWCVMLLRTIKKNKL